MELKEYMFNFVDGGWNTVYAKTLPGARKAIKERFHDSLILVPDLTTVRVATKKDYDSHMAMFY
jgi:hypothetical protein